MLKRLLLAASLACASTCALACTDPLVVKDGNSAFVSMSVSNNADGFCQYNFNLSQVGGATLGAATAWGVAPSGNVIGVNANVLNTSLAVTQSGTWNVGITGSVTLPTGASTAALQTTGNTSLSSIDGKTPALGQALSAASVPVVLPAAQITTLTPPTTITANQGGSWTATVVQGTGSNLHMVCDSGCSGSGGTSSSFAAAFPASGTAIGVKNGSNMVNLTADGSSNLNVNCAVGCAGGSVSNATSGVATSSTNNGAVSWLYGFNGTTWDQLQVDASKFLKVDVAAGTVAATQSGTWNVGITGTPTVTAAQATAANLNATVVGTGTFATQAAQSGTWNVTNVSGTVSLPTGASTSANQTATQAPVAAGTAAATKSDLVGAQFLTTQPTMTNTQQAALLASSRGELLVAPGVSGFPVTQSGTWNIGSITTLPALVAGSAIIGKVGIDQTTPGTTNGVQVNSSALPTGAATAANQATEIASLATIATNSSAAIPAGTATIGNVGNLAYPIGATPITASATGTTAATTATLAGASGKTTYICGYSIRANATANTNVTNTLTGVISGTMSSIMWIPANTAGLGVDEQIFSPCIPASAANTAINAVSGAPGSGGLVSSKAWGYQL